MPTPTHAQFPGRVASQVIPAAELAVILHAGLPRRRGPLLRSAGHVRASHALQVDGPVREYYLVGRSDTRDEAAWRTEIGWPIFSTGAAEDV